MIIYTDIVIMSIKKATEKWEEILFAVSTFMSDMIL